MINKELTQKYPYLQIEEDNVFLEQETKRLAELQQKIKEISSKKINHFASDSKKCDRLLWFVWKGTPTMTGITGNSKILELGEAVEENVIFGYRSVLIDSQKPVVIPNVETGLQYHITGRVDLLVLDTAQNIIVPIEVKFTKDFGEDWEYAKWTVYLPKEDHIAQLMVYLHALKMSYGYLHYYNKNRSVEQRYKIQYSEEFYKTIVDEFKQIEESLKNAEPPPIRKEYSKDRYPCAWFSRAKDKTEPMGMCPYYFHCWGLNIPEKPDKKKKDHKENVKYLPVM